MKTHIDAFLALDESESVYDRVARDKGIDAARKAAAEPAGQAVDRARQAIECYAREIRDTGDKGVVAQMNEQFYNDADGLPAGALSDGQWHRVTWNLKQLVEEKLNGGATISNLILGTWESPAKPVQVDFRSFSLGTRNTLD